MSQAMAYVETENERNEVIHSGHPTAVQQPKLFRAGP